MMNKKNLLLLLFVAGLYLLTVFAMYNFAQTVPGANDFYPRWRGAQLFWREGIDPYSQLATDAIQTGIYGRLATPEEDQVLFVYPFYTVFLLIPLIWFDYVWAQAIWLATLQFSLIGASIALLKLLEWRQPPWLLALTLLWSIIFYNSTRTIILGQFAALIFLWLVLTLLALKTKHDVAAAILLALTTIKPQMSFIFIPLLLLWAWRGKRWQFIGAFGTSTAVLVGLSFLLLPSWLGNFIEQLLHYPSYTITGSPLWVITDYYFPWLGKPVEYALILALLAYLVWEGRALWQQKLAYSHFLYIVGIAVIVTNMIVVRTATTNYIIMYVPLFLALYTLAHRSRHGRWAIPLFYLLSFIFSWALFIGSIEGDLEHPITYLPLPFSLLAVLLAFRRQWLTPNDLPLVADTQ